MCGRYHVDKALNTEIQKFIDSKVNGLLFEDTDIFPGSKALIITGSDTGSLIPRKVRWGFPGQKSSLVINARSESADKKPLFRDSLASRRCLIPARSFYEWDKSKNKVNYSRQNDSLIFMAGIYNLFDNEDRFTILTTAANDSVSDVHERMPVIIDNSSVNDWIFNVEQAASLMTAQMPSLKAFREYEQMTFGFI